MAAADPSLRRMPRRREGMTEWRGRLSRAASARWGGRGECEL